MSKPAEEGCGSGDEGDDDGQEISEEDPFWQIALNEEFYLSRGVALHDRGEDDDDLDGQEGRRDTKNQGKITRYHLPSTPLVLELAPLPADDGVWAPVGADAWYSSALLASMILSGGEVRNDSFSILPRRTSTSPIFRERPFRVLELGSGAVGLSGLACAAALSLLPDQFPLWTVCMTDNQPDVLDQLRANVKANLSRLVLDSGHGANTIVVEPLDWSDDEDDDKQCDSRDIPDCPDQRFDECRASMYAADLVIGSELVYTSETGTALVKLLLRLLRRNPSIRIFVVQVVDRYGWSEIVIPALESAEGVHVQSVPISWNVHDMAGSLIQMGGTLDRHAYGAFCISHVTI